jgi:parallel beta-helix repeat protein
MLSHGLSPESLVRWEDRGGRFHQNIFLDRSRKNLQAGGLMNSKTIFSYFLAALALFLAGADAATITVGPEGCDYVSIQAAIDAASPGDVVEVAGGTYRENLVVDMPIVLRGAGNGTERPIVDAGGSGSCVTIVADGVRLEGFVLKNGGFGWAGIEVRSGENLIIGNLVTENRWYGIFLDGSRGTVVEENVVWKNKYGIWINAGSDENEILENVLEANENYNAFDLGANFWEGNFYGDYDWSLPIYEVPGISSIDRSPSGPEKEEVVEAENESITIVEEDLEGGETGPGPDSGAEAAGEESYEIPISQPPTSEEEGAVDRVPAERPALSLMDLGPAIGSPSEGEATAKDAPPAPAGPAVGDAVLDAELGEAEADESAGKPLVEEPQEGTGGGVTAVDAVAAVEAYSAEDWTGRGDYLCSCGRYSEALICYDRALEMEPELACAWDGKGDALTMTGSYDKALRCYERALVIDPDSAESWYNKGNTLQMLLRFDEALGCYDEALRIDPNFAEALNKRGMTLNRLGRYREALGSFDRALEIVPGYAAAWNNKSWAHQMLGEDDAAKEAFEKAKELG